MHSPLASPQETDFPRIHRARLEILQVNLGYRCNLSCMHCHVAASPRRSEEMTRKTMDVILDFMDKQGIATLDLTGGAPEMNPYFRFLVEVARMRGIAVIDRCNLTILEEPGQDGLAEFLAGQRVKIIASLPCYLEENVDQQRGKGVFEASLRALQRLNALGFGHEGSGLELDLVFNPQGPNLPPAQEKLEADYKRALFERYDIVFNRLFTLANMPIQRFGSWLVSRGQFESYMALLKSTHNPGNLSQVMCRSLLSVDWQGFVHDCDFNQMLGLGLEGHAGGRAHLSDFLGVDLQGAPIRVADHCYGCTAGQGSSCGGALELR